MKSSTRKPNACRNCAVCVVMLHNEVSSPVCRKWLTTLRHHLASTRDDSRGSTASLWRRGNGDVLDPLVDSEVVRARLRTFPERRRRVGTLLLDQHFFCGIGNYLRAEILWLAGLHPTRTLGSLDNEEAVVLTQALLEVTRASLRFRHARGEHRFTFAVLEQDAHDVFSTSPARPPVRSGGCVREHMRGIARHRLNGSIGFLRTSKGAKMPQLNVGTRFTPQHATALATIAARGWITLPDLDAVLGAGIPGAGRAELLNRIRTIIPHAQNDIPTAAAELMALVTAGPAGPHPWSQALPAGKTEAQVTLYGKRTDNDGCNTPSGHSRLSLTLHEGFVVYANVRAPIDANGCFSAPLNDKSGSFSGKVRGSVIEFSSSSRYQVRQGNREFWQETRYDVAGHAGGPGFTADADAVEPIRRRTSSDRLPYGLAFGLPVDLDGAGDAVHRRGQGQLQAFSGVDKQHGQRTVVALRDGRKEAAVVNGAHLATWQAQWTANDVGPLGYPLSDERSFVHQNKMITVQVFEGGYVFGDGTVEARTDAETGFRARFPEYKTPEEIEAKRQADFERQHRDQQSRTILAPVYALLEKRKSERAQGYSHRQPSDFESARAWIQQNRPYEATQLLDYLKANWPSSQRLP